MPRPKTRRELILENEDMVDSLVRPFEGRGVDTEDLRQEGFLALCIAANRATKGCHSDRFRSYARFWVRSAIARAVSCAGVVRIPAAERRLVGRCMRAAEKLIAAGDPNPSVDQMAIAAGVDVRAARVAFAFPRQVDLDPDKIATEEAKQSDDLSDAIEDALQRMTKSHRDVTCLLFGLRGIRAYTRKETATSLGLQEPVVSRYKEQALEFLEDVLTGKGFGLQHIREALNSRVA